MPSIALPRPATALRRWIAAAFAPVTLLLCAACGATGSAVPSAADPAAATVTGVSPDAAEALRSQAADLGIPGMAVSVSAQGRTAQWVSGRDGDGAAMTATTPFLIGSVSKSFTALVTMSLVEAGDLGLDDRVSAVLPGADTRAVTVRGLLRHTSGYSTAQGLAVADRLDTAPGAVDRAAQEVAGQAPDGPRGTYADSDANYLLLGSIIERVTGRPLAEAMHAHILDPLGMTGTTVSSAEADRIPPGHRSWWGAWRPFDPGYDDSGVPYGHIVSDLEDLTIYARALAGEDGHLPVSAATLDEMTSPQAEVGTAADGSARSYGYSWRQERLAGHPTVEHTGATPGCFTHVLMLPEDDIQVVVLADGYAEPEAERLVQIARQQALIALGEAPEEVAAAGRSPRCRPQPVIPNRSSCLLAPESCRASSWA